MQWNNSSLALVARARLRRQKLVSRLVQALPAVQRPIPPQKWWWGSSPHLPSIKPSASPTCASSDFNFASIQTMAESDTESMPLFCRVFTHCLATEMLENFLKLAVSASKCPVWKWMDAADLHQLVIARWFRSNRNHDSHICSVNKSNVLMSSSIFPIWKTPTYLLRAVNLRRGNGGFFFRNPLARYDLFFYLFSWKIIQNEISTF